MKKNKTEQRFNFRQDDDGHHYLIRVNDNAKFDLWLEAAPYWDGFEGKEFDEDMLSGGVSSYSFTSPERQ